MIVEYFGIPGGGKTYHANLYKMQLKATGQAFLDISRHKRMPLRIKLLYKIADYAILFLPKYRKQINLYKKKCKDCNADVSRLDGRIKNIVLCSFIYHMMSKTKKIIINDEGQLHWILLICARNNCSMKNLLPIYSFNKHADICRCVNVSIERAFQQIRLRNQHVCYIDEMDDGDLLNYLSDCDKSCKEILKQITVETIS